MILLLIIVIAFLIFQMIIMAVDIDIGVEAIDRDSSLGTITVVNEGNPANDTGEITSVEIWAASGYSLTDCEVATFYIVSGNNLSTRDHESIGGVTGGSKQTFEVSLAVQAGDYLGMYYSDGKIEYYSEGGVGVWTSVGDNIPCINHTFSHPSTAVISLYGTGTTEEVAKKKNVIFMGSNF